MYWIIYKISKREIKSPGWKKIIPAAPIPAVAEVTPSTAPFNYAVLKIASEDSIQYLEPLGSSSINISHSHVPISLRALPY